LLEAAKALITDQQQEAEMKQLLFRNRCYNQGVVMIVLFSEHYFVVFYSSFYTCLDRHARHIHRTDCLRHLDHQLLLHSPRLVSFVYILANRTQAFSMMLTFLFGHIQYMKDFRHLNVVINLVPNGSLVLLSHRNRYLLFIHFMNYQRNKSNKQ